MTESSGASEAADTSSLIFLYSTIRLMRMYLLLQQLRTRGLAFFDGNIPCSTKRQMIHSLTRISDEDFFDFLQSLS